MSLGLRDPFLPFIERPELSIQNHSFCCFVFFVFVFVLPYSSFCFPASNLNCLHFLTHDLPPFLSHSLLLFSLIYQHFSFEFTSDLLLAKSTGSFSIVHPQSLRDDALKFPLSLASADTEVSGSSSDFLPILFVALGKPLLPSGLECLHQ